MQWHFNGTSPDCHKFKLADFARQRSVSLYELVVTPRNNMRLMKRLTFTELLVVINLPVSIANTR